MAQWKPRVKLTDQPYRPPQTKRPPEGGLCIRAGINPCGVRAPVFIRPASISGSAAVKNKKAARTRECDTEPVLFSPYDVAMPARLIGLHDQREFVGNSYCVRNIKGGTGLWQVSDRATIRAAVEFDRRAFEDPTSNSPAIFIHAVPPFLWAWMEQVSWAAVIKAG
jgi:hypothetical protein